MKPAPRGLTPALAGRAHAAAGLAIAPPAPPSAPDAAPRVIGVLEGEGIGPEVVGAALGVLDAVSAATGARFEVRRGGPIGKDAERISGAPLTEEVASFCEGVFSRGGAVLAGPGGGRFVYDLRRRFDLFVKLSPVRALNPLADAGPLRWEVVSGADVLVVRDNAAGVYQGTSLETRDPDGARRIEHRFSYGEHEARRVIEVGARCARARGGRMTVVVKESGVPAISRLWAEAARAIARERGVEASVIDVDLAAYRLVREPRAFDVVVAPNLVGDILSDLGGIVVGARGLTFGASYSAKGAAVYQTNHGAAYDLAGSDRANPGGQILSLAMLLRESFGLEVEAALVETALSEAISGGARTADLAPPGARHVGTREMARAVVEALERRAGRARVAVEA